MRNTWVSVSSWRLCTGYLASPSVFQAVISFSMTVFKREIISQSVLTWLKIGNSIFFLGGGAISEMQKVLLVLQACNFYISCSMESNLVADWWWTVWFDILFTFSWLLNLHPCCRIRTTKCVQRTIALFISTNCLLLPFSVIECCEVVMFKPWTQYVWSKSGILFFLSQHAQPPLGLWLHTLQCEWINILLRTLLFGFC